MSKDNWSSDYIKNAAFVPKLASIVVDDFLQPKADDTILDVGCGDGKLTAEIAKIVKYVHGLDSSPNLLKIAHEQHGLDVTVQDAQTLTAAELTYPTGQSHYDKVFSNAALHWILTTNKPTQGSTHAEKEQIRQNFFNEVYKTLRADGGVFAAEFGGLGNVSEIHAAFVATLIKYGLTPAEAHAASPWYYPHEDVVRGYLEHAGFTVEKIERVYRSTLLPHGDDGMLQWLDLFGFAFVEAVQKKNPSVTKDAILKDVLEILRGVNYDPNSNQWFAGYVRLRFRAIRA